MFYKGLMFFKEVDVIERFFKYLYNNYEFVRSIDTSLKYANNNYGNILGAVIGAFITIWIFKLTIKKQDQILINTFMKQKEIEQDNFLIANRPILYFTHHESQLVYDISFKENGMSYDLYYNNKRIIVPFPWSIVDNPTIENEVILEFHPFSHKEVWELLCIKTDSSFYVDKEAEGNFFPLYFLEISNLSNLPAINIRLSNNCKYTLLKDKYIGVIQPNETVYILLGTQDLFFVNKNLEVELCYDSLTGESLCYKFNIDNYLKSSDSLSLLNNGKVVKVLNERKYQYS